ncbi:hypothetical protein [Segatella paludivivens]|uniref:hypothetical protein n=1 Tax=Segatella paludivivens TaxID=185294 RepID=UPI000380FEBB|nr:hypothetical protein [Segatella paludivivens]
MKNLKPFNGDAKKEYKDAVSRMPRNSVSRSRLELIEDDIETVYDHYKKEFDNSSLNDVKIHNWSAKQKEDLLSLYGYHKKIIRNIKNNITNQQIMTIRSTCQNCTIDSVNTMDHILPKIAFPEYAVNGYNLFPCCSICNGYKADITDHSAFLNLFIDELPSVQYLFVEVHDNIDCLNFDFFLSNSKGVISNSLYKKIENHYTNLHLIQRMKAASLTYLAEFISTNKHYYKKLGRESIIEAVLESIDEDRRAYGFNYWKCSLKLALISSEVFWNYMDNLCV